MLDNAAQLIFQKKTKEIVDDISNGMLSGDIIQAEMNQNDINIPSISIPLDSALLETAKDKVKNLGYSIEALVAVFIQQINKRL